jgi:hypothetical protein
VSGYAYRASEDAEAVVVSHDGQEVTTLHGAAAAKLVSAAEGMDEAGVQALLERAAGDDEGGERR